MLNFNQLRVFYHVAKNLSFTSAANDLFITQPAVTAQVKAFEEFCNLKLFKKRGRGVDLSDEGKTIYRYARQVFEYEKEIENVIDDLRELKRGVLRLGTTKTYARYIMHFLMGKFRARYPHIKILLDEGSSLAMIYSLLELKNEIAIIAKAQDNSHVRFIPFSQEELVLTLSPDHPLTRKERVSFEDVCEEPVIMKEIGSGTRKLVNELFERHQCIPNILMETGNTEFIKQLVERGEGISFLVRESVKADVEKHRLATRALQDEEIFLDVSIAFLKDQQLSPSAQAFLACLDHLAAGKRPIKGIGEILRQ